MVPLESVAHPRDNVPQAPTPPNFSTLTQGVVPPSAHPDEVHFPALHPAQESALKHDIRFLKHYIPALHNVLKDLEQLVDDGSYQNPQFTPFEEHQIDGPFSMPGAVPPHFRQPIEIQPNQENNGGPTFKAPHFIRFHPNSIVFPDSPTFSQSAQFGAPPTFAPSTFAPPTFAPLASPVAPPLFHSENAAAPIPVAAVPMSLSPPAAAPVQPVQTVQPAQPTPVVQNTVVPAASIPSAPKA